MYRYLLQYPEFKEALKRRLDEVYTEIAPVLKEKLDYLKQNEPLKTAVSRHEDKYKRNSRLDVLEETFAQSSNINAIASFEEHVDYINGWMFGGLNRTTADGAAWGEGRLEWLKRHIDEL